MAAIHDTENEDRDTCTTALKSLPYEDPIIKDCIFQGQINAVEVEDVFDSRRTTIWKPIVLSSEKNVLSGSFALHVARSGTDH